RPRGGANGRGGTAPADAAEPQDAQSDPGAFADLTNNPSIVLLPGMSPDAPTESVAITGNTATPQFGGAFDPRQLNLANIPSSTEAPTFGAPSAQDSPVGNAPRGGNDFANALGGIRGGGPAGGRGGRGGNFGLGGQRGRNANPINVNLSYTLNDSA